MYITKATARAMSAYINIFSSGCLNLFFRSHSKTSSSDISSPEISKQIKYCSYSFYLLSIFIRIFKLCGVIVGIFNKYYLTICTIPNIKFTIHHHYITLQFDYNALIWQRTVAGKGK